MTGAGSVLQNCRNSKHQNATSNVNSTMREEDERKAQNLEKKR